jgi:hypothetical protein
VAFSVFNVLDAASAPQKLPQLSLALHIWSAPQILSIDHQKVESTRTRFFIVYPTMQRIEVRHPI